jgi:hypothetical protein
MTSFIGCTLLTLLTPASLLAEIGSNLTDADYLTKYGTSRRPQSCPSKSEPRTGRLSVAQAIKYARCYVEEEGYGLNFVDVSKFQLSPPRRATETDYIRHNVDRNQPVYNIKAYALRYHCVPINREPSVNPTYFGTPGNSCSLDGSQIKDPFNSDGICFKDLTERWSCRLYIPLSRGRIQVSPPAK